MTWSGSHAQRKFHPLFSASGTSRLVLSLALGRCDSLIQLGYFSRRTPPGPLSTTQWVGRTLHPGRVTVPRGGSSAVAAVRLALSGKHVASEGGSEPYGKRVGAPESCQSTSQPASHSAGLGWLAAQLCQLPPTGHFDHCRRLISSGETFPRFRVRALVLNPTALRNNL